MCIVCSAELNSQEAFAERLMGMMTEATLALMLSLGHRSRLFDTLAELPPSTSHQIADAAGLNERYVREWLGALVTGRIVTYEPRTRTYELPAAHAALLSRNAPGSMGHLPQFLPVLAQVEDQVLHCFHNGGGVPYEAYNRFHEVMAEESGQTVVSALHEHILPLAPGLVDSLKKGVRVLDVGCGSGRAINELARTFPNSQFVGYDLCKETVERARAEARACKLKNARFERRDVTYFGEDEQFDLITAFDAIHDQARPAAVLAGIRRALAADGLFLMQDISTSSNLEKNLDNPLAPFIYGISCMHCMTVSLAQGGEGLGAAWGREKALEMLAEAGFDDVSVNQLPHDPMNDYYLAR